MANLGIMVEYVEGNRLRTLRLSVMGRFLFEQYLQRIRNTNVWDVVWMFGIKNPPSTDKGDWHRPLFFRTFSDCERNNAHKCNNFNNNRNSTQRNSYIVFLCNAKMCFHDFISLILSQTINMKRPDISTTKITKYHKLPNYYLKMKYYTLIGKRAKHLINAKR
jgi:hypothetical protein